LAWNQLRSSSTKPKDYAKGVEEAFRVFTEYGVIIHAIIRYRIRDEAQVDDLFQDFFLYLVTKPIPTGVTNVKGYLYRMITNHIADAVNRTEKYQARIRIYAELRERSIIEQQPENPLIIQEETDRMCKLIERRLQQREAQAINLRFKNNDEIKQIAQKMHVNKESVSRYISVGLSKIRKFLNSRKSR
jgi:RNA polymerase sigma factor (sigma-70 family)